MQGIEIVFGIDDLIEIILESFLLVFLYDFFDLSEIRSGQCFLHPEPISVGVKYFELGVPCDVEMIF